MGDNNNTIMKDKVAIYYKYVQSCSIWIFKQVL